MSFTYELKKEILEKENSKMCCSLAELAGIVAFSSLIKNGTLRIVIENKAVASRIIRLMKRTLELQAVIDKKNGGGVRKNDVYVITVIQGEKLLEKLGVDGGIKKKLIEKPCCKKAFLKGAFLGGGSVSDPGKRYHLEFVTSYSELCEDFKQLLAELGLKAGTISRRGKEVIYFKDCDSICDVLAMVGVNKGVMEIYEVKVIKDKKNELNRINNMEVANIYKTADAAANQIKCINKIAEKAGLEALPEALRKLADVRLKYPDEGLAQLGKRLDPPLGKSGVNHRMRKIIEISKRY